MGFLNEVRKLRKMIPRISRVPLNLVTPGQNFPKDEPVLTISTGIQDFFCICCTNDLEFKTGGIKMKKITLILLILFLTVPALFSLSAGTGISVFVPESLYRYGEGSVSLEQSLEFALGLNDIISLPIGVTYNTNYGLTVAGESKEQLPWFYSDSLMPYVMLKAHFPLGPLYLEIFGGAAGNYNFTLRPLEGNIEKDLSTNTQQAVLVDGSMDFDKLFGWGYLAGGALGVTFGDISVDIAVQYRSISHGLNFSADYASFSQVNPNQTYDRDIQLLMQGISVGLGGSFAF